MSFLLEILEISDRNPDEDLPTDFETKRQIYYQALTLPEDVETFISSLQQQIEKGLEKLDKGMPRNMNNEILWQRSETIPKWDITIIPS